ncbi:hypothetical protein MKX01_008346 [Papaver californicum]|nr:hypothetical protein MKX01_008346 [Papaver californicum]
MTDEVLMLPYNWDQYSFEKKGNILSKIMKDVKSKLNTDGYSTKENVSKDLELIQLILMKFDDEENRNDIFDYKASLTRERLMHQTAKILCFLWDIVNSSKDISEEHRAWMRQLQLHKISKDAILNLCKNSKDSARSYEFLLNKMQVEVPVNPRFLLDGILGEVNDAMIDRIKEEYELLKEN